MPKSKRSKTFHLTQVQKHGREHKDTLFSHIRECIPQYHHCFVFSVDNMRNNHLKDVRRDLRDSRLVFLHPVALLSAPSPAPFSLPRPAPSLSLPIPKASKPTNSTNSSHVAGSSLARPSSRPALSAPRQRRPRPRVWTGWQRTCGVRLACFSRTGRRRRWRRTSRG